ncbi:hypothetical protein N5C43_05530 [Comamonas terrigena]|uniref:hypothetical protein n=1 Tax=Comamonas terrigena TaxID=32013 RepID=UPI00244C69ED|nr:hypothetical protein [Comamonas terrigena]MDH1290717.1 hypothetical protein [Comamonas terrigena]
MKNKKRKNKSGGTITKLRKQIISLRNDMARTENEVSRMKIELHIFEIERKIKIAQMNNKSGLNRPLYEIRVAST